ncbi:MAG: MarR family winged helix-turn-helix transcriptional regulator [Christensenellaceae bacterium]
MEPELKEAFVGAIMRFKKVDICAGQKDQLQFSELVVMGKASSGCVCGGKGMNVSEIQQVLHLSKPAVSQTLNGLEKKGYITRTIDPSDRRKITVTLTPAGQKELESGMCCYDRELNEVLERFGAASTKQLIGLISRLIKIIEEI